MIGVRIAEQLYRAEAEILRGRTRDGAIDPRKVADRPLLPSGRLAP